MASAAPIARCHRGTGHGDFPHFSRFGPPATASLLGDDAQFRRKQRLAHGTEFAQRVFRCQRGHLRRSFSQAVRLQHGHARVGRSPEQRLRRRTATQQYSPQRLRITPIAPGVQHAVKHGRHHRQQTDSLFVDGQIDRVRVKAFVKNDGYTVDNTAKQYSQAAHVKQWHASQPPNPRVRVRG